jgi:hypothetical protein
MIAWGRRECNAGAGTDRRTAQTQRRHGEKKGTGMNRMGRIAGERRPTPRLQVVVVVASW